MESLIGKSAIRSRLLLAKVMHERTEPKSHRFVYPLFALRLDLQELEQDPEKLNNFVFGVNKARVMSFRTRDYGPRDGSSLLQWAQTCLQSYGIEAPSRIELHTMPRIFGYAFNPISIWYCFDQDESLSTVIAEVNNTFGEHHFYVLRAIESKAIDSQSNLVSAKAMHVSPFCEVKGRYQFQFKESDRHALVHIDYYTNDQVTIKTAMASRKLSWSANSLLRALLGQPFLTLGVFWRIHWQAFLLWLKGVPFFRLPAAPKNHITLGTSLKEER